MMIEQPAFGRRLRRLRQQRGLSQGELAGDDVSASYVSRVESGGRSPNDLIASLFARRLEVPLEALTGPDPEEEEHRGSQRLDVASQLLTASALRKDGELTEAAELLRGIVTAGAGHSEEDLLWEAAWVLAEVLRELGQALEEHTILTGLAETSLSQETPRLAARVATALSENLRQQGRLGEAVRVAETAVSDIVTLPPTAHERVNAMLALLNAYAESGELENAARLADTLQEIAEDIPSRQLRGQVYWAVGSTRFLSGLPQEAARLHEQAFGCLRPDVNLLAWARLCRASAALRLEHDPSEDALESAEGLLTRARQAIELVGRADDLADLMLAEAQLALRQGHPERVLELAGRLGDGDAELPSAKLGQCHLLSAKAYLLTGDTAAAQDSYRQAAETLERAGAYRKSSEAWRQLSELLTPGAP
ncbi:helix-turn-helix transcriptional regulator [Streptomyces caniscabiei]|uniref:helix-turn-helix transcriptional regulator n=1 Tax=Streptomyces caniscabiei TaxID=2746961 RepID=UPI0029BB034C|nr:helix-turn-helix transcriptional regulator [Streptomyces caniscabiei]MDX2599658.1 helix-turn-helix transcriptional regulator [Streptomyces caniscabiei]MDX2735047.1 helix-turn-helix transcriptional regulator [Streptomyces caniscabiei]MDX2776743.1 helix-turn-helix transcriptional regulator [Streptomyces caniscabiei]